MAEILAVSPELLFEIAAGSVGGFCSKALDYPFDTAKVLLQTQQRQQAPAPTTTTATASSSAVVAQQQRRLYTGTLDCIQHSIREKGFLSLYNGIGARLVGSMAENAVCFLAYGAIKKQLLTLKQAEQSNSSSSSSDVQLSLLDLSIAGAGSGAVVSFIMTPIELIKCRLQVAAMARTEVPMYRGSVDCLCQTLQKEGILRGLYRGHTSTMMREVPGNFCWYLTYEMVCDALAASGVYGNHAQRQDLPVQAHMIGGAAAGVMYWAAIFPVDTVKSVLQTSSSSSSKNTSFAQALQTIYQEQGLRGLYRGFGVTAVRAAPANAVLFAGYEQTVQFLKNL